jgi:hypothetical protein
MALERYEFNDLYTEAELAAKYRDLPPGGRLRLLQSLEAKYRLPLSLKELAAKDESPLVRGWVARTIGGGDGEKAIYKTLRSDNEEYVRVACMENGHVAMVFWKAMPLFLSLGHIERLALMRNPELADDVILAVFDLSDDRAKLSRQERIDLVLAFLTNENRRPVRRRGEPFWDTPAPPVEELGDAIWERVTRWPEGWNLDGGWTSEQAFVFQHVACTTSQRTKSFSSLKNRLPRAAILRHAEGSEECLRIAVRDDDDESRGRAFAKWSGGFDERKVVEKVLAGFDLAAMRGLVQNEWIECEDRERVRKIRRALGDKTLNTSRRVAAAIDQFSEKDAQEEATRAKKFTLGNTIRAIVGLPAKEDVFVLPSPLAELKKSGVDTFCARTFPKEVREWTTRIHNISTMEEIHAVVDSAEKSDSFLDELDEHEWSKNGLKLTKGADAMEVGWAESFAASGWMEYMGAQDAGIFDTFARISIRWNGEEVLTVRMGGDGWGEYGSTWHIISIKKYQAGPWLELIKDMNEYRRG